MIGELAALCAAISFTTSSTIFSYSLKYCTPIQLNFLRGVASIIFMYLVLLVTSVSIFPEVSIKNYLLLIISGIIGIGIGESFYLKALDILGPNKTILLETFAPPFTGLISYFYYGTTLSVIGWIGIIVTAYGIYIVVNENDEEEEDKQIEDEIELDIELISSSTLESTPTNAKPKKLLIDLNKQQLLKQPKDNKIYLQGIISGVLFTACQAFGMVLSHDAISSQKFSAFQSSLVRTIAGVLYCMIIIYFKKQESYKWPFDDKKKNYLFILGTIFGPIIGILSQQTSLKYSKPEITQTILATTPLFSLAINYYNGKNMKIRYLIGSLIAILGVCIIIWG